jgi:preprotein translocase subunit YajC
MSAPLRTIWILAAATGLSAVLAGAPARADDANQAITPEQPIGADDTGPSGRDDDAETDDGNTGAGAKKDQRRRPGGGGLLGGNWFLFVMLGGLVLLFVLSSRSRRKQDKRRREMLASLKTRDKVTTIGGIVGTVVDVREDEVTVKVDEQNNVRMRFARWAIRGVGAEGKQEHPEQSK